MFDEPPITNQKDMPECNTFLDKCENIALRQMSKKIFALYLFCYKKHCDYDFTQMQRFHCFSNS